MKINKFIKVVLGITFILIMTSCEKEELPRKRSANIKYRIFDNSGLLKKITILDQGRLVDIFTYSKDTTINASNLIYKDQHKNRCVDWEINVIITDPNRGDYDYQMIYGGVSVDVEDSAKESGWSQNLRRSGCGGVERKSKGNHIFCILSNCKN